jgi:hypothetical protein
MLELGIVIFIVLILLFIVFFGGLSKDATVPGTETGTETGPETGTETGTETGPETGTETGPETGTEAISLLENDKRCKIIKINANGHCGYIAIMYKLEQLQNVTFKKIFKDKLKNIYINRLLSCDNTDVELFYKEIIEETLKLVTIQNDKDKLMDKKVKEIDNYHLSAISNKFNVNIHIHQVKTNPIIIKPENNGELNQDIHLLKTGEEENGHYDLLDC